MRHELVLTQKTKKPYCYIVTNLFGPVFLFKKDIEKLHKIKWAKSPLRLLLSLSAAKEPLFACTPAMSNRKPLYVKMGLLDMSWADML